MESFHWIHRSESEKKLMVSKREDPEQAEE